MSSPCAGGSWNVRSAPSLSLSGSKPTASTTASTLDASAFAVAFTTASGRTIPSLMLGPPQLQCTVYSKRILCGPAASGKARLTYQRTGEFPGVNHELVVHVEAIAAALTGALHKEQVLARIAGREISRPAGRHFILIDAIAQRAIGVDVLIGAMDRRRAT